MALKLDPSGAIASVGKELRVWGLIRSSVDSPEAPPKAVLKLQSLGPPFPMWEVMSRALPSTAPVRPSRSWLALCWRLGAEGAGQWRAGHHNWREQYSAFSTTHQGWECLYHQTTRGLWRVSGPTVLILPSQTITQSHTNMSTHAETHTLTYFNIYWMQWL